jgi:hypothetical protein
MTSYHRLKNRRNIQEFDLKIRWSWSNQYFERRGSMQYNQKRERCINKNSFFFLVSYFTVHFIIPTRYTIDQNESTGCCKRQFTQNKIEYSKTSLKWTLTALLKKCSLKEVFILWSFHVEWSFTCIQCKVSIDEW